MRFQLIVKGILIKFHLSLLAILNQIQLIFNGILLPFELIIKIILKLYFN